MALEKRKSLKNFDKYSESKGKYKFSKYFKIDCKCLLNQLNKKIWTASGGGKYGRFNGLSQLCNLQKNEQITEFILYPCARLTS